MIEVALRKGAPAAVPEWLQTGALPGFGRSLYPEGDPRAAALLDLLAEPTIEPELRRTVDDLVTTVARRGSQPNIDFSVAVLAHATSMEPGASEVIFAIARTAGWIAHVMEEYAQPNNRFRWRSGYIGPRPASV
jgi:citrate synthase